MSSNNKTYTTANSSRPILWMPSTMRCRCRGRGCFGEGVGCAGKTLPPAHLPKLSLSFPSPDPPQDAGRWKLNCRGPPPLPRCPDLLVFPGPFQGKIKEERSRGFLRVLCRFLFLGTEARSFEAPPTGQPQTYLARARCVCLVAQSCPALCDPVDLPSLLCPWGFSRQEYWSGVAMPSWRIGWEIIHLPLPTEPFTCSTDSLRRKTDFP